MSSEIWTPGFSAEHTQGRVTQTEGATKRVQGCDVWTFVRGQGQRREP